MTGIEAVEILESRYGHSLPRHRQLIDPAHPDHDDRYVNLFARQAECETRAPGRVSFEESYLNVLGCDYRDQPDTSRPRGCGCEDRRVCGLGKGLVNLGDCLQCVKGET